MFVKLFENLKNILGVIYASGLSKCSGERYKG